MKLIIDIDDNVYDDIEHNKGEYINTLNWAVRNGTPISNEGDLISREALKKAIQEYTHTLCHDDRPDLDYEYIDIDDLNYVINNAPSVAESCKELHEVATERPQTIGCFNCKHETKMVCEEPCMVCNSQYSEWRQKE